MNYPESLNILSVLMEHLPYVGLFLFLVLGAIGLPFPEDAILILCGVLISQQVVKLYYAIPVVYSGLLLTDFGLYSLGRKYGRKIVTHKKFHRIISPEKFSRLEKRFKKGSFLFFLVGRQLVGVRSQVFILSGVMKMPPLRFVVTDTLAATITIALMVTLGYTGSHTIQGIHRNMVKIEYIVLFILSAAIAGYLIFQFFKSKRNQNGA